MTANFHDAALAEARTREAHQSLSSAHYTRAFTAGAVWAAKRVTPTREQLVDTLDTVAEPWDGIDLYKGADAILALLTGLAEGEHDE